MNMNKVLRVLGLIVDLLPMLIRMLTHIGKQKEKSDTEDVKDVDFPEIDK